MCKKRVIVVIAFFSLSSFIYPADDSFASQSMDAPYEHMGQDTTLYAIAQSAQNSEKASDILLKLVRKVSSGLSLEGQDGLISSLEKSAGLLKDLILYIKNLDKNKIDALDREAFLPVSYFSSTDSETLTDTETLYDSLENDNELFFELDDHKQLLHTLVDYLFFTLIEREKTVDTTKVFFALKKSLIPLLYCEYEICQNGRADQIRGLLFYRRGQRMVVNRSLRRDFDEVEYQDSYTLSERLPELLEEVNKQEKTYNQNEMALLLGSIDL